MRGDDIRAICAVMLLCARARGAEARREKEITDRALCEKTSARSAAARRDRARARAAVRAKQRYDHDH